MTDDAAYGAYGRGTVEPGDRPAVLVVDYQKAFTTDGLGMGGIGADRARRRQHGAPAARRARRRACPCSSSIVSFGEAEGGLGLWGRKVPSSARSSAGSPWVEIDERLWDPSDSLLIKKWPSVFAGTPLAALLNAQRIDTVIVTGCTTSGCVRATHRRCVLERLPDARARRTRVGDQEQGPHDANLLDCQRRYAEVTTTDACIEYLGAARMRRPPLEDVRSSRSSSTAPARGAACTSPTSAPT